MKFEFSTEIKGLKKSTAEGTSKIFEGATLNFSCDANVPEIVEILKDKQLGFDKLVSFIKQDLPQSIKDCGHSFIQIERENRIMNNELPRNDIKRLMNENKTLQEKYNDLNRQYNFLKKKYIEEGNEEYTEPNKVKKIF